MVKTFRIGEHVSWNSEAGRVRGKIIKVHRRDVDYKGYIRHASSDDPLYEIKSDTTNHVALHRAAPLRRLGRLRSSN
jgi:Hypervirulence associated proteins TUDOR domain